MPYHQTTIYQDSFTAVYVFCRRSLYEFSKRETLEIPAVTARSGKYRLDIYRMVVDATVTLSKKGCVNSALKTEMTFFFGNSDNALTRFASAISVYNRRGLSRHFFKI